MKLAIAVHGAPYSSEAPATALRFARAALAAGHSIDRVFFYHDGVHGASALAVAPQDEPSPAAGWIELARQHGFELAACIAASSKRGVIDGAEAERHGLGDGNVDPAFAIVGLGQLIEAIAASDRFVSFAA